jgi:hypothetical protein
MLGFSKEVVVRMIKILDIGYSTAVYFFAAIVIVVLLNKYLPKYDKKKEAKKSTTRLVVDIVVRVWLIGVFSYFVRNVFHAIPWIFEGVHGYKHLNVKEVSNSAMFTAFAITFDPHIQSQIAFLKKRLNIMI